MAYKALTVDELLALMKKVQGKRTDTEFANELGISKQYLCDMYNGRKAPSDTVSSLLGYESRTETHYIPTTDIKQEAKRGKDIAQSKATRSRKRHSG